MRSVSDCIVVQLTLLGFTTSETLGIPIIGVSINGQTTPINACNNIVDLKPDILVDMRHKHPDVFKDLGELRVIEKISSE